MTTYVPVRAGELAAEITRARLDATGYAPSPSELWREAVMRGLSAIADELKVKAENAGKG